MITENWRKVSRANLEDEEFGVFMWLILLMGSFQTDDDAGYMQKICEKAQEISEEIHELSHIRVCDRRNMGELI